MMGNKTVITGQFREGHALPDKAQGRRLPAYGHQTPE